jgi:hypothetical protein
MHWRGEAQNAIANSQGQVLTGRPAHRQGGSTFQRSRGGHGPSEEHRLPLSYDLATAVDAVEQTAVSLGTAFGVGRRGSDGE